MRKDRLDANHVLKELTQLTTKQFNVRYAQLDFIKINKVKIVVLNVLKVFNLIIAYHTYILNMNNVIKQIEQLNKDVKEYWIMDEKFYYMTEGQERHRLFKG